MNNLEKAEKLLDHAIKLPVKERTEYLDRTCKDDVETKKMVKDMIANFEDASIYFKNLKLSWSDDFDYTGSELGVYSVEKLIGEGGMGKVYLGTRNDGLYEQEVAIKVLKLNSEKSIEIDNREQQILSDLDHPGIAKIFNAGKTKNNHTYLVMEYISGVPIEQYVENKNLSIREIGHLILQIGDAVQHAHQNRVIHRDLKPSNILINKDEKPKLLDFGISVLDHDLEEENFQHIITPNYCAPEQIEGSKHINVTTDVYLLGILFYKLLCKKTPFELTGLGHEQRREKIKNTPAPSIKEELKGSSLLITDFDIIISRALRKKQSDRYQSIDTMMEEVRSALSSKPLQGKANDRTTIGKKFLKRNTGGVAVAAAIILMLLTFSIVYTVNISRERDRANQELIKANSLKGFLVDILQANDPTAVDPDTVTLMTTLENAREKVSGQFTQQPEVQNELYELLADIYISQGNYSELEAVLQEHSSVLNQATLYQRATWLSNNNRLIQAGIEVDVIKNVDSIFSISELISKTDKYDLLATGYVDLGLYRMGNRELEQADSLFRLAFTYKMKGEGSLDEKALTILNNIGDSQLGLGNYQKGIDLYDTLIPMAETILPESHPYFATYYLNKGAAYSYLDNNDSATYYYEKALALNKDRLGEKHPMILFTTNNLASAYMQSGNKEKAKEYYHTIIELGSEVLGAKHLIIGFAHTAMARMVTEEKNYNLAEDHLSKALKILPEASWFHGLSQSAMAVVYQNTDRLSQASRLHDEAFEKVSSQRGEDDLYTKRVKEAKVKFENEFGK